MTRKSNNSAPNNAANTEQEKQQTSFFDNIKAYIDLKWEYTRLDAADKLAMLAGRLVLILTFFILGMALFVLLLLMFNTLLIHCIGVEWLAELIELVVVIAIMGVLWHFRQKIIIEPIANSVIKTLFNEDELTGNESENETK